jgi:hypothetical protein
LELEPTDWFGQPEPFPFDSHRVVVKIGSAYGLDAVAVVSGFSAVTAALASYVARHVSKAASFSLSKISTYSIDLRRVAAEGEKGRGPRISFVEAKDSARRTLIWTSPEGVALPPLPSDWELVALGLSVEGADVKVSPDLTVHMNAAECPAERIDVILQSVFENAKEFSGAATLVA